MHTKRNIKDPSNLLNKETKEQTSFGDLIKRWVVLIALQACTCIALGQDYLKGNVIDSTGNPLSTVLVYGMDADSSVVHYTFTDAQGNWSLTISKHMKFLTVKKLGYEEQNVVISGKSLFPNIVMSEDVQWLDEILVAKERLGVESNGDTIKYDLEVFNSGFERNLGDVLDNLPGMDVSENGDVEYNGKRVDLLLLEGVDILGYQHKVATEGIQSDYIDGIEVLKNYKSVAEQYSNRKSGQVAVNVDLTEEALDKWVGNAKAGGGYAARGKVDVNGIKISDKFSATTFLRFNNTGEAQLNLIDYLSLQTSPKQVLKSASGNLDNLLPKNFQVPEDLQNNLDGLLASNVVLKHPKTKIKGSVVTNLFERDQSNQLIRNYWDTSEQYLLAVTTGTSFKLFNTALQPSFQVGEKSTLILDIPINYEETRSNQNQQGTLLNLPFNANQEDRENRLFFNPGIEWINEISKPVLLSFGFSFLQRNTNPSIVLSDLNDLSDLSLNQRLTSDFNSLHAFTSVEYRSENWGVTELRASVSTDNVNSSSTGVEDRFDWQYDSERGSSSIKLSYEFDSSGFFFNPAIELQHISTEVGPENSEKTLFNYELLTYYKFRELNQLSFSFEKKSIPFHINLFNPNSRIIDFRTLQRSEIISDELSERLSGQIHYINYDFKSGLRIIQEFNLSQQKNGLFQQPVFMDQAIVHTWTIQERERTFSTQTSLNKPLFRDRFTARASLGFNRSKVDFNNGIQTRYRLLNYHLGVKYTAFEQLSIEGKIRRRRLTTSDQNEITAASFNADNYGITLLFKHRRWTFRNNNTYQINRTSDASNTRFYKLDITSEFDLKDNFTLYVTCNDLLNLDGALDSNAIFDASYLQTSSFNRFPGYLLLGGNLTF